MFERKFLFSSIENIENRNFDQSLENFYRIGISGGIKENIQNSLDAKLESILPVKVLIETGKLNTNKLPGYRELKDRIQGLSGANQYTLETIDNMKKAIKKDNVHYITFEDRNTKGLEYIAGSTDCSYIAYAYQQGNHYSNTDNEATRGGSHGIGKIASNALSDIHLMYFANCDKYNNKLIGGTICLVEHKYGTKSYRSMGYFTDKINKPYTNNYSESIFKKDIRGLKIIIPFLKEEYDDECDIIRCVCSNYFYAIHNNMLVVEVNGKVINSTNLSKFIFDEKYFIQNYDDISKEFVVLNYKTYIESEKQKIHINFDENYEFDCYFKYDENIKRGRVAFVRRMGMKITDRKIPGYIRKPFNAVVIPSNDLTEEFLKSLENQAHNEIDTNSLRSKDLQKKANKVLRILDQEIKNIYDRIHNKLHPSEGLIDTGDLLYTFDKSFKNAVNKNTSTMYLNTQGEKKQITKINMGRKRKEKESQVKKNNSKRKIKKAKKSGGGKEVSSMRYIIYPENIHRLSLKKYEILECNLDLIDNIDDYKKCNIIVKVIDGEGEEVKKMFLLSDWFDRIEDLSDGKILNISGNIIKNIKIKDKKLKIKFYFNIRYNSNLKYIYYVEV